MRIMANMGRLETNRLCSTIRSSGILVGHEGQLQTCDDQTPAPTIVFEGIPTRAQTETKRSKKPTSGCSGWRRANKRFHTDLDCVEGA